MEDSTIKKKKRKKWPIVLTLCIVVFLVLPIGLFFLFIFDTKTKDTSKYGGKDVTTLMSNTFINSITNTGNKDISEEYGKITGKIYEKDIDELLCYGYNKAFPQGNEFIKRAYCEINDNHYNFYVDIEVSFIKTRLVLETTLGEVEVTANETDSVTTFTIDKIKLARFELPDFLINLIISKTSNFINDAYLEEMFAKMGLHVKFNIAERKITYKKSDMVEDVRAFLLKTMQGLETASALFSFLLTDDVVNFNYKNKICYQIDLEKYHENQDLKIERVPFINVEGENSSLNSYREKVKKLLDENVINNEIDARNVFLFLMYGSYIQEDNTEYTTYKTYYDNIKNIDLSTINITDKLKYHPIDRLHSNVLIDNLNLTSMLEKTIPDKSEIITKITNNEPVILCKLDYDILNEFSKYLPILGETMLLVNKDENNKWIVNYIVLNSFDFVIDQNDGLVIHSSLSINGYKIETIMTTTIEDVKEYPMKKVFKIKKVYLGTKEANEEFKASLLELLNMEGQLKLDTFSIDKENKSLILDFTNLYEKKIPDEVKNILKPLIEEGKVSLNIDVRNEEIDFKVTFQK